MDCGNKRKIVNRYNKTIMCLKKQKQWNLHKPNVKYTSVDYNMCSEKIPFD